MSLSFTSNPPNLWLAVGQFVPHARFPEARGGAEPISYELRPIPRGLQFDWRSRMLTGAPTEAGSLIMIYEARDRTGQTATLRVPITVSA